MYMYFALKNFLLETVLYFILEIDLYVELFVCFLFYGIKKSTVLCGRNMLLTFNKY